MDDVESWLHVTESDVVSTVYVYLPTKHQRALGNSFKDVRAFLVELEFSNVGFCGGRKTGEPGEKPLEQGREPTTNKLNPHMTPSPQIEPGPHWWEASALTTAPSLLPQFWTGAQENL